MSGDKATCIELKFLRGPSMSRRAKARDLWTFLDSQTDLKPYIPRKKSTDTDSNDFSEIVVSKTSSLETSSQDDDSSYPWFNELCRFKSLGLDKIALAVVDTNRNCHQQSSIDETIKRDEYFADTVEESYEEITSDLQAFEKRVKKNPLSSASQQIYKFPEKYERFL